MTRASFLAVRSVTGLPQKEILKSVLGLEGAGLVRITRSGKICRSPSAIVSLTAAGREALEWCSLSLGHGKPG